MIVSSFGGTQLITAASSNWVELYSKTTTIGGNVIGSYDAEYKYHLLDPSSQGFVVPDLSCYRYIRLSCSSLSIITGTNTIHPSSSSSEYTKPRFYCGFTNLSSFSSLSDKKRSEGGYFWEIECTLSTSDTISIGTNLRSSSYNPSIIYNDFGVTGLTSGAVGYPVEQNFGLGTDGTFLENPNYDRQYYFFRYGNGIKDGCVCIYNPDRHYIYQGDTIYLCGMIYNYRAIVSSSITYSGTFKILGLPY